MSGSSRACSANRALPRRTSTLCGKAHCARLACLSLEKQHEESAEESPSSSRVPVAYRACSLRSDSRMVAGPSEGRNMPCWILRAEPTWVMGEGEGEGEGRGGVRVRVRVRVKVRVALDDGRVDRL